MSSLGVSDPSTSFFTRAIGGLDEQVTDAVLHAAFVPFGDLKDVNIPLEQTTQKNRGFGFVTFMETYVQCGRRTETRAAFPVSSRIPVARFPSCFPGAFTSRAHHPSTLPPGNRLFSTIRRSDDAAEALNNMHNAELFGRVIRCNYAQPPKIKGGDAGFATQPVWADADQYARDREAAGESDDDEAARSEGTEANVD
jgi:hypothetical protein